MNILYCGDKNIIDGLIISILSLVKNTNKPLYIYVLTMKYTSNEKKYEQMPMSYIKLLDGIVKNKNKDSFVKLYDITDIVSKCMPSANLDTRFTPYCMLRLYADEIDDIPDKILYLDNDVVCLNDPETFYNIDNEKYELVGVLDFYGSHFFKQKVYCKDYLNSGVLLLNMNLIKKTKLFEDARNRCQTTKMFLPDQTALNILSKHKLIVSRRFNEQHKIYKDTVFRHYSTTFKFWPKIHTQTIKPWHIDSLHDILKDHEFDDILENYLKIKGEFENE